MLASPPIQYAVLGWSDSLILMVLALVVFGPRRLPEIGRQIGKLMYEFRKASNDFKFQMEEELRMSEESDRRKAEEERLRTMALQPAAPALAEPVAEPQPGAPSPYPGEETYPPVIDAYATSTSDVVASVQAASDQPAVDPALTVQPPSEGETVAAERPGAFPAASAPVEPEIAAASATPETSTLPVEAASVQPTAATPEAPASEATHG